MNHTKLFYKMIAKFAVVAEVKRPQVGVLVLSHDEAKAISAGQTTADKEKNTQGASYIAQTQESGIPGDGMGFRPPFNVQ